MKFQGNMNFKVTYLQTAKVKAKFSSRRERFKTTCSCPLYKIMGKVSFIWDASCLCNSSIDSKACLI